MKVKFLPQDVEYDIELNETVLHLAQRNDIHIQSVCKGIPSCAECRIQIKQGELNVPPPSSKELNLIGTAYYVDQSRLACQLRCFGDVVIDLSEQIEKEARAQERPIGPQGRTSSANKETHAIKGNIIEEYKDETQLVDHIDPQEERPGHDHFYDSFAEREAREQKPQQNPHSESRENSQKNKGNRNRRHRRPGRGNEARQK